MERTSVCSGTERSNDYFIEVDGKRKLFHINMLHKIFDRTKKLNTYDTGYLVAAISKDVDENHKLLDGIEIGKVQERNFIVTSIFVLLYLKLNSISFRNW